MRIQRTAVPLDMSPRRPPPALMPTPPAAGSGASVITFPRWQAACDRVSAALLGGETRVVVAGPPGTGKTLLLDHVTRVLRTAGWTVVLRLADAAPPPATAGKLVLLIDEADRLPREALQHVLATTRCPVVLAGLEPLLARSDGATQIVLRPLAGDEARDYIARWLAQTGRQPGALQAAAALRTIEIAGGVPRLVSTLISAAAWLAESAGDPVITVRHVEEAAALRSCFVPGEPGTAPTPAAARERSNTPLLLTLAATTLLLGAGAFTATRYYPAETEHAVDVVRDLALYWRTQPDSTPPKPTPPKPTPVAAAAPREIPPPPAVAIVEPPKLPPAPVDPVPDEIATSHAGIFATPPKPPPSTATADLPPTAQPTPVAPPAPVFVPPPTVVARAKPVEPPALSPETITLLLRRGTDMMAIGDISAARLLFVRAAQAGNADAMLEMGRTFDPTVLAQASPQMPASPAEAETWYRRAASAGNPAAQALLARESSH